MKKVKGLTNRIAAMLMSGMLVVGAVPGIVLASEPQADIGQTSEIAAEVPEGDETEEVSSDVYSEDAVTQEEAEAQYYTVTLDANGGYFENEWDDAIGDYAQQAVTVTRQIPVGGAVAAVPVFSDQDGQTMTFAGWSLEPDGELVSQTEGEYVPVDNCALYAVWQVADVVTGQEDTAQETDKEEESGDTGAAEETESNQEYEDAEAVEENETGSKDTEEAESTQEFEETTEDIDMDQETAEDSDVDSDAYAVPESYNEQDAKVNQEVNNTDEEIGEESSNASEETDLEAPEEETVKEDAANGVVESGTCGDNLTWTLDEEGTLTISGTGEMYFSIYGKFKNYSPNKVVIENGVTTIGDKVFNDCESLTSVTIPNSITSIGGRAFNNCVSLTSLTIPDGVTTIGDYAFCDCSNLMNITIPNSVTSIMESVFKNCSALTSVTIPDGVTSIRNDTFYGCSSLTSITIPNSVTNIYNNVFYGCSSLTSITIPNSVTSIGYEAFYGCSSLTSITIPNSVTNINNYVFDGCSSLTSIYFKGKAPTIFSTAFTGVTATAYYPANDPTWTKDKMKNYGGTITWVKYETSGLELDPEFVCGIDETITVSATYTSQTDAAITASKQTDADDALEFSDISVLGPFKVGLNYESYISVMVTGKKAGEYNLSFMASDGTTAKTVIKVEKIDISKASVKLNCQDQFGNGCDCFPYTGEQIKPEVLEVKVGSEELALNTDYTISYGQNIKYGEATVTIKGTGNYSGEKVAKFMIVPDKVRNLRYSDTACGYNGNNNVGASHRTVDVKWDAINNVAGYWIEYSEDREFSSDIIKQVNENKYKTEKGEELERNKQFYVRVKAYININGAVYFGAYSDILEYKICNHLTYNDFFSFPNNTDVIGDEYFHKFYTPAKAYDLSTNPEDNGSHGKCLGFTNLTISILCYGYPPLSELGVQSLSDLESIDQDPIIRDDLYYLSMMNPETDDPKQGIISDFEKGIDNRALVNDLNAFMSRVENYTINGGHPVNVIIGQTDDEGGPEKRSHAIIALDIAEKTDTRARIRVYDCNHGNEERFIELYGENGVYTRWRFTSQTITYEGSSSFNAAYYDNDYPELKAELINEENLACNDRLMFTNTQYDEMVSSILAGGDDNGSNSFASRHYNDWLISVSELYHDSHDEEEDIQFYNYYKQQFLENYDGRAHIPVRDNELSSGGKYYFWVPKTSDNTLKLEGAPAGSKIQIAGNMHSVTVQTDAECDLSIYLPETGEGEVQAASIEDNEVQAVFYDFDEDGDRTKFTRIASVNADTPATITKHSNDESDQPVASGECGDELTWTLDNEGTLRISGNGEMNDYSSSESPWNEYKSDIRKVRIKKGVTSIGKYAFYQCVNLTSVTIPESVMTIGWFAFSGCSNITDLTLVEGLTNIGMGAFSSCSGLTDVTIPESVTGMSGFMYYNPFPNCTSLTNIYVKPGNMYYTTVDGVLYNKNCTKLICYPAGKSGAFSMPESVTSLDSFCFYGCKNLTNVSISENITAIGRDQFIKCSNLSFIVIPSNVKSIGLMAFNSCASLTGIVIPSSVTSIGSKAFKDCSNLSVVYFIGTQEEWEAIEIGTDNTELTNAEIVYVDSANSLKYAEISGLTASEYTGRAIEPEPVVRLLGTVLEQGKDYTVSYSDNINAGTATVTVAGMGSYVDSATAEFTITPASLSAASITGLEEKTFIGRAITQNPVVTLNSTTLTKDTDYTLTYKNNTNAGMATVTVTGKGNYSGTVSKNFTIRGASIANATVTGISNKTYTGSALTQNPTVKVGDKTLTKGMDYTVSYANNMNVGTATVTITGKGNYASKKNVTFKINKAAQSITAKAAASSVAVGKTTTVSLTGAKGTKSYKSSNTTIATVTSAGKVTAKKVGTVKITATSAATSNYNAASKTITIKVVPIATASLTAANQATGIKLTWKKVTGANGYKVYRGSTLIKTITSGSTVTYADTKANTNGTKYTYKVVAKASTGDSTLSKSVAVYRVARPAVSSVTNSAASKMTVKWGKNAKANGYQIQYSTDKTFKSGNKAVTVTGASTVSKVIGSLTKGKTYYVRIRTYKTVGSAKYWSVWSAAKGVKISK